jgi:hypothetical protein
MAGATDSATQDAFLIALSYLIHAIKKLSGKVVFNPTSQLVCEWEILLYTDALPNRLPHSPIRPKVYGITGRCTAGATYVLIAARRACDHRPHSSDSLGPLATWGLRMDSEQHGSRNR